MTTGLIPGAQPPDPRPTGTLPQQRHEPDTRAALHVDNRPRSSVITARAVASFEPVGRSVATARSFVRDTLQGWGFADIVDDAVVLTSELVKQDARGCTYLLAGSPSDLDPILERLELAGVVKDLVYSVLSL